MTFTDPNVSSEVLREITLDVPPGEVLAIRGANGTGKTTLLNLVARLTTPTTGTLRVEPPPEGRPLLGFVQQDYTSSLLPWFDVLENVALPLRLRGVGRMKRRAEAAALLDNLGFTGLPPRSYPHQLSGGQRQRIAIGRALVGQPALLLLDEPFANLDSRSVRDLQEALLKVQRASSMTVLFVSHELDSSIYLADRVVVLNGAPATITGEFPVSLPRPRTRGDFLCREFLETRAAILRLEESLYARG